MKPQKVIAIIEAEALRFTAESAASIIQWLDLPGRCCHPAAVNPATGVLEHGFLMIPTPLGGRRAELGDWVVRLSNGAMWPCEPNHFEQVYQAAT